MSLFRVSDRLHRSFPLLALLALWGLAGCGLLPQASAPAGVATAPVAELATDRSAAEAIAPSPTLASAPPTALPAVPPTAPATLPATPQATLLAATAAEAPTVQPAASATTTPLDLSISASDVRLHPNVAIYDGDRVTFQLFPYVPESIPVREVTVRVAVDGQIVAQGNLGRRNWAGMAEGVFEWAWDTTGLAGTHEVNVSLDDEDFLQAGDEDPDNNETALSALVLESSGRPALERDASWISVETECCVVHVISRTAAERDLTTLVAAVDAAVAEAARQLRVTPLEPIHFYFVDRVIGQGGYAGGSIVVSYLDRQYAGQGWQQTLVHEAVHILDTQFAPNRIAFLGEGLAVWASGGHYKPEDLGLKAAGLLQDGSYIPLAQLADDFYASQHEIGYLEAGSFVAYLIDRLGWPTFRVFYEDVALEDGDTPAAALDLNLRIHYNGSLAEVEDDWLEKLRQQPFSSEALGDLETTIHFYEVMRRYQIVYDPGAHFLTAWFPAPAAVEETGNVADLVRRPRSETNVALEVMLQAAEASWLNGDYPHANTLLASITRVLDSDGTFVDPLASSHLQVVRTATAAGYRVQRVELNGNQARAVVSRGTSVKLVEISLSMQGSDWVVLSR